MSRVFELERSYRFEAAHYLPYVVESHACRRLHGHSYRIDVVLAGPVNERAGWLVDFADIDAVVEPVCAQLDHQLLNDIDGLSNPTSEELAGWLWGHLAADLPHLAAIRVAETPDSTCVYRGTDDG